MEECGNHITIPENFITRYRVNNHTFTSCPEQVKAGKLKILYDMKKLRLLALVLIMGAAFVSCDKTDETELDLTAKSSISKVQIGQATPAGVSPVIIPGENQGGNRTCAEVGAYFKTIRHISIIAATVLITENSRMRFLQD